VRGVKKKKNFERLVENLLQICENCALGKNLCISRLTMTSVKSLCENMPFRSSAKYEEVSEIGNGAYGTVFKAIDKQNPGLVVALKKVRVKLTDDGVPMSTLREIALLKQLESHSHPNIVK
uniref:cyclin-dependent kinase n=1 Tax=Phlebotomus papatasi TaxID=29031 RepID=A0A1B0DCG5_PHLPP